MKGINKKKIPKNRKKFMSNSDTVSEPKEEDQVELDADDELMDDALSKISHSKLSNPIGSG